MTEHGERMVRALGDGAWWTVADTAKAIGCCQRLARSTLVGAVVGGLVEHRVDDERGHVYRLVEGGGDGE